MLGLPRACSSTPPLEGQVADLQARREDAIVDVGLPEWEPPEGEAPDLTGVALANSRMDWVTATRTLREDKVKASDD